MSLHTDFVESDLDESDDPNKLLNVPKKKTARRSLESQFETCLQEQTEEPKADENDEPNNSACSDHETLSNTETSRHYFENTKHDIQMQTLTVTTQLFRNGQIGPASSNESLASSTSAKRRARSPCRTPSFCAAVSASLISIDEDVNKIVAEKTVSKGCKLKIKSKNATTSKSVTSLPSSPHVPNQTSTPAPNQIITISSSHTNTIDSDAALCRICHDGDGCEELVSPCYCTGSVGALHMTCLERWLGTSNTTKCEICKYEFKVERKPRPLREFLRHPTSTTDKKNMLCDLVCFVVLTPLTVCSAFLCLMGVQHYTQYSGHWEVVGLASLTACLLSIYTIWCCVAIKHHVDVFRDWRQKNQDIKIIYLSPTKGKTVLRTKTIKDTNNNNHLPLTPARALGCRTLCTPSALTSVCRAAPSQDQSTHSYTTAMLRPILKYSANLQAYNPPSNLHSPNSFSQTFIWGADSTDCGTNPLLYSHYGNSQVVGKETCV